MALLVSMCVIYALALGPLRRRYYPKAPVSKRQITFYITALGLLFLVLTSPLHLLAETYLVSAHMLQLALIIYLVAPLVILGVPGWAWQALLNRLRLLAPWRTLTRPKTAFVVFHTVVVLWHLPAVFRLILFNEALHSLSYAVLLATALVMWWPLLSPLEPAPKLSEGPRVLYIMALVIAHMPLMLVIGLSSTPLYPWYAAAPRVFELSPVADQQLGSMLMMSVQVIALMGPLCVAAWRWLEQADKLSREQRRANHLP